MRRQPPVLTQRHQRRPNREGKGGQGQDEFIGGVLVVNWWCIGGLLVVYSAY